MIEQHRTSARAGGAGAGVRLLIVEARFYNEIADRLLDGAREACRAADARFDLVTVPGALEIAPAVVIACDAAAAHGLPYDGVVALGCVIRGETYHFEIVANESARALTDLAIARGLPIGNGVLTVEDETQALTRANLDQGDKGGDAVHAALALIALKRRAEAI